MANEIKPDITATVHLYRTEEGGRKGPTSDTHFGCPMAYKGHNFDCRLLLKDIGRILPGDTKKVPIKFLVPTILNELLIGDTFKLWDGGIKGEGKVEEILIPYLKRIDLSYEEKPSITAALRFYETANSTSTDSISADFFCCLLVYADVYYNCKIDLKEIKEIKPGHTAKVTVKFLYFSAAERLKVGDTFNLRNKGIVIGEGKVEEILVNSAEK